MKTHAPRRARLSVLIGLATLLSALFVALGTASAEAATNWHGCPQYSVCLYRHANYVGDRGANVPDNAFSDCGSYHNISGYLHHTSVVNHEAYQASNDGTAIFYTGHGTGALYYAAPNTFRADTDLYPINSVRACRYY